MLTRRGTQVLAAHESPTGQAEVTPVVEESSPPGRAPKRRRRLSEAEVLQRDCQARISDDVLLQERVRKDQAARRHKKRDTARLNARVGWILSFVNFANKVEAIDILPIGRDDAGKPTPHLHQFKESEEWLQLHCTSAHRPREVRQLFTSGDSDVDLTAINWVEEFERMVPFSLFETAALTSPTRLFPPKHVPAAKRRRKRSGREQEAATFDPTHLRRVVLAHLQLSVSKLDMGTTEYFMHCEDCETCKTEEEKNTHAVLHKERRWQLSRNLFSAHRNQLKFDPIEMCDILNSSFKEGATVGSDVAFDELLYQEESKAAPTRSIARKPHNLGVQILEMVGKMALTDRPYCFSLLPDMVKGEGLTVKDSWRHVFSALLELGGHPFNVTTDGKFGIMWAFENAPPNVFINTAAGAGNAALFDLNTRGIEEQTRHSRTLFVPEGPNGRPLRVCSHGDSKVHNTMTNMLTIEAWLPYREPALAPAPPDVSGAGALAEDPPFTPPSAMADVNVGLQEIFAMEGIASGQELYGRLKEHVLTCMLPRILPPDTALLENLNQYKRDWGSLISKKIQNQIADWPLKLKRDVFPLLMNGEAMPELEGGSGADKSTRLTHIKLSLGIDVEAGETREGGPAGRPDHIPPWFVDTPLARLFDVALEVSEEHTTPLIKAALKDLGVPHNKSASKRDVALRYAITQLTSDETRAIYDFIKERCPEEPHKKHTSKPIVSKGYSDRFNVVDIFNRLVYELYNQHPVANWYFRVLLYFMSCALINLWSWLSHVVTDRKNTVLLGKRDVCSLKKFCRVVLAQLQQAYAE